jgi:hypothetical protein
MPVNIYPVTALTVFEKQNFINKFVVPAGTVVQSYTISTSASPIGVNWNSAVTVTSDATTSITIAGFYDNVFVATTVRAVSAKSTAGSEVTYTNFTDIPTNPYPYAFTYYQPDTRDQIEVTVVINCNTGTTSLTQYVRNDYNYYRNRFIDLVHAAQVDVRTNTTFVAPDLPLPADINSETLKNVFVFITSITTNIQYFNLMTAATAAGYAGTNALFASININPGVYVWSDNTSLPAFQTGTLPSGVGVHTINLNNDGFIIGKGGDGVYGGSGDASTAGNPGGPAMSLGYDIIINNNSYIAGGGGSGAVAGSFSNSIGGGGAGGGNGGSLANVYIGGTGGAPGQPGSDGRSNSGQFPGYGGGGGGGRVLPGTGGAARNFPSRPSGGGAGGGSTTNGVEGNNGGAGGSGGNPGEDRQAGGGGGWGARGGNTTGGRNRQFIAGAPGGKAIALNGYTVTYANQGTIYGAVS